MREWKPGDMAIATVRGEANVHIFRTGDKRPLWRSAVVGGRGVDSLQWHGADHVADIRPLVVIDPEDRETFRTALEMWTRHTFGYTATTGDCDNFAAALRSLIEPPKPEEPTGLGAVVEVESQFDPGRKRRLVRTHNTNQPWFGDTIKQSWDDIPGAVRVLSEGVHS